MDYVSDRKKIAKKYLKGWFFIDLVAIFPFDMLMTSANSKYNPLVRVARFGRLYKLVKLTKLMRVIKIIKDQARMMKLVNDYL